MTFTAGEMSATLMVSTMDDNSTEVLEYFTLMITSVGRPDVVEIGSPSTSVITVVDNHGVCVCVYVCACVCVYVCVCISAHMRVPWLSPVCIYVCALTMSTHVCNTST